MDIRYDEWLPGSVDLQGLVTAYWQVTGDGTKVPPSAVLPDGHVELVFNLGDPVGLAGPAYTGDQPERAIVGPLAHALRLEYRGMVRTFGIRFHPARGAGFFGQPATCLMNKLVPLVQFCPALDAAFSEVLSAHPDLETEAARAAVDGVLLAHLCSALPSDAAIVALVDRIALSGAAPPVTQMARELGLSPRQLQRRFRAVVGFSPKLFVRVLRFARVWQVASMRPEETWSNLAAEYGFADQAHLVREFRAFGAEPPTRVFSDDWYNATALSRVSGPAEGVRFVQDLSHKPCMIRI